MGHRYLHLSSQQTELILEDKKEMLEEPEVMNDYKETVFSEHNKAYICTHMVYDNRHETYKS